MSDWITVEEAAELVGIKAGSVARWAKRNGVETAKKGRRRMYSRTGVEMIVAATRVGEGVASVAGISLEEVRWLWVEDARGRRPFFCVEDIKGWLKTTTDTYRLIEGVSKLHKGTFNQRTLGGVQAMWHVSIGGMSIVVARSRSNEERASQLLAWAANIIEDISLGKAQMYVPQEGDTSARISEGDVIAARAADQLRRSLYAGHRSKSLTDIGLQHEMCKVMKIIGVEDRFIRWPMESEGPSVQRELVFGNQYAVNEDLEERESEEVG